MCGINGYMQFRPIINNEQINHLMSKMNSTIIHRGPDDDGFFINENIGLGMRRLSIIDLKTGKQPIFNEDKSHVIVLNGEVYNYKELKKDLLAKGHQFSTQSDTEVVLHCYEEYGPKSFEKLKGMFAFAIYDLANNKVLIVRDLAGEKPLYYYINSDTLVFASELKSMLISGIIDKKICRKALNQYLLLTYIPAPLTIFEEVYKLLPGHYMEADKNGDVTIKKYWDVSYSNKRFINDYEQCKSRLRETLFNAVEECMVSDVPIGAFLSGGIDSTIISGIMSKISTKPINTFTIGYKDKQYDESGRAKAAASFHKTNHHTYYLNFDDVLEELYYILSNLDEPFADSSYIPTYMVSKYARQHVKAVLTGDAGDELFGGYSKYLIGYYSSKFNKIPKLIRENLIKNAVYSFPESTFLISKVRKVIDTTGMKPFNQHENLMYLGYKKDELPRLLNNDWLDLASTDFICDYYYSQQELSDELSRSFYTDFKVVLEGDMLKKVDRASMLCSLETRVPMLHKDVVELAARIPSSFKIKAKKTKYILKETFKDLVPNNLLNAGKRGFGVPIENWFRNELQPELVTALNRGLIESQGIFEYDYIQEVMQEHMTKKKNRTFELWVLFVFQNWYQRYFI